MIDFNFNNKYDTTDATIEIIIMLLGAFVLGFLFSFFLKKVSKPENDDIDKNIKNEVKLLKQALENCKNEKAEIKKNITIEYSDIIDDYKSKLNQAREDLENCLANKSSKD